METSKVKNMVVLRNLPSNIVDEAIIILKNRKKIKNLEKVEQKISKSNNNNLGKDKDYILKEAEMLVNNYMSKVENKKEIYDENINSKYKKLKKYSIVISIFSMLQLIINICH